MPLRSLLVLAAAFLVASCASDSPTEPDASLDPSYLTLARAYRMTGDALARTADGRTAECVLDLVFELNDKVAKNREYVEYTGTHGGDVARAVTAADGSGFAFSAFVFAPVTMRRYRTGELEIHIPINETTDVPFYREMARWEGVRSRGRGAEGPWRCAPLQIDEGGYVDLDIVAEGSWRLTPQ